MGHCTVSHFSYAPLIQCTITLKRNITFYSEIISAKHIYIFISHWYFIVIRSEMNEKMNLEGLNPQNTISHCNISSETQITLHLFQSRISAMPEIRANLFLAISMIGMCLLTSSFFKRFTNLVISWRRFEKTLVFSTLSKLKFRMNLSKLVIKTLLL